MRYQADTYIRNAITSFDASSKSPHEQVSRIDFVARLILGLTAHSAISTSDVLLDISSSPGPDVLLDRLKTVKQNSHNRIFNTIAQEGIQLLTTRLPSHDSKLQSINGLRHYLFHGGSKPAESEAIAQVIKATVDKVANRIAQQLAGGYFEASPVKSGPCDLELELGGTTYRLSPLLACSSETTNLLVFSRLTANALNYSAAKHEQGQYIYRTQAEPLLRRYFRQSSPDTFLSDLAQAAIDDLDGFREMGSSVTYIMDQDGALFSWKQTDGSHIVDRSDRLRVGLNNTWQWERSKDEWCSYTTFLRNLASWPTLTQRLYLLFKKRAEEAEQAERRLLPLPNDQSAPFIIPTLKVAPIGSQPVNFELQEFADRLTKDVQTNRGTTCLYFVHAEAGAGKTTALIRMAHDRANEVAQDITSSKPLFLYISARGNVLEDLDKAIDATVTKIQLLNSSNVQALCRNGLIIPIIDGFDELVGSLTYDDALHSLRPWLRALGGRGVLVVSARSSYFVSMYEESIRRETNRDISVNHYIATLDRWTPKKLDSYMQGCGVSVKRLGSLPSEERELLELPFFARASVRRLLGNQPIYAGDLLDGLILDYIKREQKKLQFDEGSDLVKAENLTALFAELAGYMQENNTREISLASLHDITDATIPSAVLPQLRTRVVALCGIDVHGGTDHRFRFSHEVFLDYFFGSFIANYYNNTQLERARRLFTQCKLTSGAARVFWAKTKTTAQFLESLTNKLNSTSTESPISANAGLLWAEMFRATPNLENITFRWVSFDRIDLSEVRVRDLSFINSLFVSITLPNQAVSNLIFKDCRIETLYHADICSVICFDECSIDASYAEGEYSEEPSDILSKLKKRGATIISSNTVAAQKQSDMAYWARFFLEKITSRSISIVLGEDHLPEEDPRLNWIARHPVEWVAIVRALKQYGLALEEPLGAGGPYKVRLRFVLMPQKILHGRSEEPEVGNFWEGLNKGLFG